eukprot:2243280-Prorocentrum_lima.AAC.1
MTSSLVGSEMCIRDRIWVSSLPSVRIKGFGEGWPHVIESGRSPGCPGAVSYTHLTLPTICSV